VRFDLGGQDFNLTDALREHAERRVAFALSRFGDRMTRVTMRLADGNGADKRCVLRVRLAGMPDAVITERAGDLYAAIDRAADRAGRTVARRLQRHHDTVLGVFGAVVSTADQSD
jgi:ribosomal subunit interface protein